MRFLRYWRKRSFCGIPGYAAVPFVIDLIVNMFVYYAPKIINQGRVYYDFTLPVDALVPVGAWSTVIYFASYIFWAVSFVLVARDGRDKCFRLLGGNLIGKAICLTCFLAIPTTIGRPVVPGESLFDDLLRLLYAVDSPMSLFPSLHCYVSYYACRWQDTCKRLPKLYRLASWIFTLFIFYSTLATRQHYAVDVIAGVVAAEAAFRLEKKWRVGRFYEKIDEKLR